MIGLEIIIYVLHVTLYQRRALIHALHTFFPKWDSYSIHESSPGGITTQLLLKTVKLYLFSIL